MANLTVLTVICFFLMLFQAASPAKIKVALPFSKNFTEVSEHINADGDYEPDQYDEVHLVLQVTGLPGQVRWTIFGLWPEKVERVTNQENLFQYVGVINCLNNSMTFNLGALTSRQPLLAEQLRRSWPTRRLGTYRTASQFWFHEIDRHGSCMWNAFGDSGIAYLQKTVELYEASGVNGWMGTGMTYKPGDNIIISDLLRDIGPAILECEGVLLFRIKLCYSNAWVRKPCLRTYNNCPVKVVFVAEA